MATDALFPFVVSPKMAELGSDIAGVSSIDAALSTVSGRRALAEAILRRLTTPRGGLWYAPEYGYDLQDLIGSAVPASVVEQRVLEQVTDEQEIEDARVRATFDDKTGALTMDIDMVDDEGPFTLTLTASELTVEALMDGVAIFQETA